MPDHIRPKVDADRGEETSTLFRLHLIGFFSSAEAPTPMSSLPPPYPADKRLLILFALHPDHFARGGDAGGQPAARIDPMPDHPEVLQPRQRLGDFGRGLLRRQLPAGDAALPVAGDALEGQRGGNVDHLHIG